MAADNNMLGQFNLESIPPAPRGVPQIEVTFDIDANGIVSVSATDKGTNKEQKITIQASSGLSDEDIDQMVRDAEDNAESDKQKRELIEAKNHGESMLHTTAKSLEEHGEKLDPNTVEVIEMSMANLKESLETDELDKIKARIQDLTESAMKLGEAIYADQARAGKMRASQPPWMRISWMRILRMSIRQTIISKPNNPVLVAPFQKRPLCLNVISTMFWVSPKPPPMLILKRPIGRRRWTRTPTAIRTTQRQRRISKT